jgi:hypothetical protein
MKALQILKYGALKDSLTLGEIEKPSVNSDSSQSRFSKSY